MINQLRTVMRQEQGVTVVELLVVMIVGSLMTAIITGFALSYWGNAATLQADQGTLVTRLNAGDYLRDAVDSASGLINQNDLTDAHVGNADATDPTGTHWAVIHAVPGTISMGASGTFTPLIYFNRPSIDTSKNVVLNGTIPYQDDVILYLNGTTKQLLARTIANSNATNNLAKTTCPSASATSSCPTDNVVADDVSAVTMRYFSRSGNAIDYTSIVDPSSGQYIGPDFPSVEVVEFNLKLSHKAQLHNAVATSNQTVIRVALRN